MLQANFSFVVFLAEGSGITLGYITKHAGFSAIFLKIISCPLCDSQHGAKGVLNMVSKVVVCLVSASGKKKKNEAGIANPGMKDSWTLPKQLGYCFLLPEVDKCNMSTLGFWLPNLLPMMQKPLGTHNLNDLFTRWSPL